MCSRHHRKSYEKPRKVVRVVRPVNLFVIGVTMMIFWFFLVQPVFFESRIIPLLSTGLFTTLMLMTMLVAAGGYVVNDLQDLQTDAINKPGQNIVGSKITARSATRFYLALNFIALLLAILILLKTQSFNVMALCASCILILWLYSKYFKSTILMGNVVVSLLIGLVPFTFIIIESDSFSKLLEVDSTAYFKCYSIIVSFTIFAFLANLIREIVKDCEDMEGDQKAGLLTLATGLGLRKSDLVSQTLTIILFVTTLLWMFLKNIYANFTELTIYLFIVVFPAIYLFWMLTKQERNKQKYVTISGHLKLMLVLGLIYLIIHLRIQYA